MVELFEPHEVEELCHRLGVKATLFRRGRLPELVDDLLQWADDNGCRAGLIAHLRRERPDIDWPDDYAFPAGADAEEGWQPDPPPDPDGPIPAPGPLPPGARLPLPPNPLFTGREDELRGLARALLPVTSDERRVTNQERSPLVTRHVVTRHYLHRHRRRGQDPTGGRVRPPLRPPLPRRALGQHGRGRTPSPARSPPAAR
jgi:hypothetical protein